MFRKIIVINYIWYQLVMFLTEHKVLDCITANSVVFNAHLSWQWGWKVHCVRSLSACRCWSCTWCLAPDLKSQLRVSVVVFVVRCLFSAFRFMFTCNSIWTQAGFDGPLNGYVARGQGCGRGFDQEARDGFCLGAPRQSDGRVIHVGNAHTARRADILKLI